MRSPGVMKRRNGPLGLRDNDDDDGGGGGTPPRWGGGLPDPLKSSPFHLCYHVKFGISVTKGVLVNRKEPRKLGCAWAPPPCGRKVTDPIKIRPSRTYYPAEFGRSRSNGTSIIKEIRLEKMTLSVPPVSRSFKVTGTDTYRSATYDFMLKFYSNNGPLAPFPR